MLPVINAGEQQLLESARQGDAGALERLIVQTRPNLRRYAAHYCASSSDAEDAVQESLVILCRRLPTLRNLGAFTGWLFQIVRRECLRLTRKMTGQEMPLDDVAIQEVSERAYLRRRTEGELRMEIALAIQSLPEIYRDVIVLRDFEELTVKEIAARLGVVPDTVKTRISRGRHMIRKHLLA